MSDWKSKLASKFNRNKDYDVLGNGGEDGVNIESYKKTSDEFGEPISTTAPMTEPLKRKPLNMQNGNAVGVSRGAKEDPSKQHNGLSSTSKRLNGTSTARNSKAPVVENGRRVGVMLYSYTC